MKNPGKNNEKTPSKRAWVSQLVPVLFLVLTILANGAQLAQAGSHEKIVYQTSEDRHSTLSGTITFTVSQGSTTVKSVTISPGTTVSIVVNNYPTTEDEDLKIWIGGGGWVDIEMPDFSGIELYVDNVLVTSNGDFDIDSVRVDFSTVSSSLTIQTSSNPSGWTRLKYGGANIIHGNDNSEITVSNIAPSQGKALNLNIDDDGSLHLSVWSPPTSAPIVNGVSVPIFSPQAIVLVIASLGIAGLFRRALRASRQ